MAEPRYLQVGNETPTEIVSGGQGLSQANVGTEARTQAIVEQENQNEYAGSVSGEVEVEKKVLGSQQKFAGSYLGNQKQVQGFERSKGEKGVVNTITVEEVKALIRLYGKDFYYTKEQIDYIVKTLREGQYVEVNTTDYPTLEDFLDSTGEQGTVYLYPTGDENNTYYQYIWEVNDWVDLGETALDLQNVIRGVYISQSDYDDLETKDENLYYFIPEE